MASSTKKCTQCKKRKVVTSTNFVKGKDTDGYCFVCNECRKKINSLEELKEYCRISKRNFSVQLWNKSLEMAEANNKKKLKDMSHEEANEFLTKRAISSYFSKMNIINAYDDDDPENPNFGISEKIDPSLILKWGSIKGFTALDYMRLEEFEKSMLKDYRIETTAHKDYLKKICKISLQMDKCLDEGNINEFEKLSKQYDMLMKSAKFTAVQRSASDDTGGLNTFSDFFRLVEEDGFIPVFPKEDRDIVDKTITIMEDYLKKLFLNDPQIMSDIELSMNDNLDDAEDEELPSDDEEVIEDGE